MCIPDGSAGFRADQTRRARATLNWARFNRWVAEDTSQVPENDLQWASRNRWNGWEYFPPNGGPRQDRRSRIPLGFSYVPNPVESGWAGAVRILLGYNPAIPPDHIVAGSRLGLDTLWHAAFWSALTAIWRSPVGNFRLGQSVRLQRFFLRSCNFGRLRQEANDRIRRYRPERPVPKSLASLP